VVVARVRRGFVDIYVAAEQIYAFVVQLSVFHVTVQHLLTRPAVYRHEKDKIWSFGAKNETAPK
jgi:hypothetical protein